MEQRFDIIRETQFPLYEKAAQIFTEQGLGEFRIKRSDEQLDYANNPIKINGIMRVVEEGEGDWLQFWNLIADTEFFLSRNSEKNSDEVSTAGMESAIFNAIRLSNQMTGRRGYSPVTDYDNVREAG